MTAIIFDLDNTLYDVRQFFSEAFDRVSGYLSDKYQIPKQEIYDRLIALWKKKTSMYAHLFDDILNELGLKGETNNMLAIFNNCDVLLTPYDDAIPLLRELKRRRHKTGIITDGNLKRQKRKIGSLGIEGLFDEIVFTEELCSSKSQGLPFQEMIDRLKVLPQQSLYVGDNPLIDFEGAKKIGIKTVRLLKGEFKDMPKNEYINYEVRELKKVLNLVDND